MTAQRGSRPRPDDPRTRGRRTQSVRRRGLVAALLLLLAFTTPWAAAQTAPNSTLTLAEARALPSAVLATRLLGESAILIRETAVRSDSLPFGLPPIHLASIDLASAPRPGGFPGLCAVDIVTIGFSVTDIHADSPATVPSLDRRTRYIAAGSSDMPDRYTLELGAAQAARCAARVPVLRIKDLRTTLLFGLWLHGSAIDNPQIAYLAVRALTLAARAEPSAITCLGDVCRMQERPASPVVTQPDTVDVVPCPGTRTFCVVARYNDGVEHYTTVTVETDAATPTTRNFAVRHVTVEGVSFVE